MAQFNIPYNNWEDGDVAYAAQVLANFNAILGAINNGLGTDNLADGSVTDLKIGVRTITDTAVPATDTAELEVLLSNMAHMIKGITGKTNWRTAPVKSLQTMDIAVTQAVQDASNAYSIANTAEGKADGAVVTANTAEGKADGAVLTANTALGQDTTEPYTGAKGAMKIALDVADEFDGLAQSVSFEINTFKNDVTDELGEWVEVIEEAVEDVADKASVEYVNNAVVNMKNEIIHEIDRKEPVATYADLYTTYPEAEDGWLCLVLDTRNHYVFNGATDTWELVPMTMSYADADGTDGIITSNSFKKIERVGTGDLNTVANTLIGAVNELAAQTPAIVDDITGHEYLWGISDGVVFLERIDI